MTLETVTDSVASPARTRWVEPTCGPAGRRFRTSAVARWWEARAGACFWAVVVDDDAPHPARTSAISARLVA
jgi:hypothetical protein